MLRRCTDLRRPIQLVESLEPRYLLTATLYLDFGLDIPATPGHLQSTIDGFRDILGPGINGHGTGTHLDPIELVLPPQTNSLRILPFDDYDYNGKDGITDQDLVDLAADVESHVKVLLAPFDIDVEIADASTLLEVDTITGANQEAQGENDAYVFIAEIHIDSNGWEPLQLYRPGMCGRSADDDFFFRAHQSAQPAGRSIDGDA